MENWWTIPYVGLLFCLRQCFMWLIYITCYTSFYIKYIWLLLYIYTIPFTSIIIALYWLMCMSVHIVAGFPCILILWSKGRCHMKIIYLPDSEVTFADNWNISACQTITCCIYKSRLSQALLYEDLMSLLCIFSHIRTKQSWACLADFTTYHN